MIAGTVANLASAVFSAFGGTASPADFVPKLRVDPEDLSEEERAKEEALQEKLRAAAQRELAAALSANVKKKSTNG